VGQISRDFCGAGLLKCDHRASTWPKPGPPERPPPDDGRRSSVQSASGGGELVMVAGLGLALLCGLVALTRFLFGLIRKLDGDRRPTRVPSGPRPGPTGPR
jgi:hypothetical protein